MSKLRWKTLFFVKEITICALFGLLTNKDLSCKEEAFQAVSRRFMQLVSYLASLALLVIQVSVANADSWTTHQSLRILRRKTIIIFIEELCCLASLSYMQASTSKVKIIWRHLESRLIATYL
jgi:hypothetical protein